MPCEVKGVINMGNRLPQRRDVVVKKTTHFTIVITTKERCGYYNYGEEEIYLTQKSPNMMCTFAHEYVHKACNHNNGIYNHPPHEYLANRVAALLAKHYAWGGVEIYSKKSLRFAKELSKSEIEDLKAEAKRVAQSFLVDEWFQEGIKLLENL